MHLKNRKKKKTRTGQSHTIAQAGYAVTCTEMRLENKLKQIKIFFFSFFRTMNKTQRSSVSRMSAPFFAPKISIWLNICKTLEVRGLFVLSCGSRVDVSVWRRLCKVSLFCLIFKQEPFFLSKANPSFSQCVNITIALRSLSLNTDKNTEHPVNTR